MSKIIGATVGTPMNPQTVVEQTETDKKIAQLFFEKLSKTELSDSINNALAQAKASGEFDGKTPQKGTDYFTEADKAELVTEVLNALPTWQGGAY